MNSQSFRRKLAQKLKSSIPGSSAIIAADDTSLKSANGNQRTTIIHDAKPDKVIASNEHDMWRIADEKLRENEATRNDLEYLDKLMEQSIGAHLEAIGTQARQDQSIEFINSKIERLKGPSKGVSLTEGATTIFRRVLKNVMKTKDVVSAAASPCLPASVACAGIMFLVSISVSAMDEQETFYAGMETISWSIFRIAQYEEYLQEGNYQLLDGEVKTLLVAACYDIMYFQVRAAKAVEGNRLVRGLRYAFKLNEWKDLLDRIQANETRINECAQRKNFRLTQDIHDTVHKTLDTVTQIQRDRSADSRIQKARTQGGEVDMFLQALYLKAYDYEAAKNRNDDPVEGTCRWFLGHKQFTDWNSTTGNDLLSFLYVTADPGCGKSVLARYLIDKILPQVGRTVCYAFFKDDFDDQRSALKAISALLHQLLASNRQLLIEDESILDGYNNLGDKFFDSFAMVWKLFVSTASHKNVVCVLDALDECKSADRKELFKAIGEIQVPSLKVLFTSRPYKHIRLEIIRRLDGGSLPLIHIQGDQGAAAEEIEDEIRLVIQSRIEKVRKTVRLSATESELLEKQVNSVRNRTYLWVTLVFDGIMERDLVSKEDIVNLIRDLPAGVSDAYEKILAKSRDPNKTRKLLHIILAAKRPFTTLEIAITLTIDDQASWVEVKDEDMPEKRIAEDIRNLCGLFVSIVDGKIYLLHQTAREFLIHSDVEAPKITVRQAGSIKDDFHAGLIHNFTSLLAILVELIRWFTQMETRSEAWECSMHSTQSDAVLAQICMATVSHENGMLDTLFKYCADNWVDHYLRSTEEFQTAATKDAQNLCLSKSGQARWTKIHDPRSDYFPYSGTPLCLASCLGLAKVVDLFLNPRQPSDDMLNLPDEDGRTPLWWAAERGHTVIVKQLIAHGADPDYTDKWGQKPLYWAAGQGHEAVVEFLIAHTSDINQLDNLGRTALWYAASGGHKTVVEMLIANGADPKVRPRPPEGSRVDYPMPLLLKVDEGHKRVVEALLVNGMRVDGVDRFGQTALLYAVRYGYREIIEMLLTSGADPNLRDKNGRTPLSWAAERGHEEVVEILVANGVKIDEADKNGRTALSYAVRNNDRAMAELLVVKGAGVGEFSEIEWLQLIAERMRDG